MNADGIDLKTLLVDWEAKRAALDAAITSLRAALAAGALGGALLEGVAGGPTISMGAGTTSGIDIPAGAFHGKTVPEAIKAYLSAIKRKQSTRQIIDALRLGGIESGSAHFDTIVYNALERMRSLTGEVAKFGAEWGLIEWVAPSMRALHVKTPASKKSSRRKGAKRPSSPKRASGAPSEESTLPSRVEDFLVAHSDKHFSPSQIAQALGVTPRDINVRLKKMAGRGRVEKVGPGMYKVGKSAVVKMPTAS